MADEQHRGRRPTFELEVERLLKKVQRTDPGPHGGEAPAKGEPARRATSSFPSPDVGSSTVPALRAQGARIDAALTWMIVLSGVGLGAALTQWPYAYACDWRLGVYLGAVGTQMITSGWAALATWRHHFAAAHVIALVALFWGIVLAAEQVLPRVGYAAVEQAWRCGGA